MQRLVFLVSDGTGITVDYLSDSLLSQFPDIEFDKKIYSEVKTEERLQKVIADIQQYSEKSCERPIVFATLVNPDWIRQIKDTNAFVCDLFSAFLNPLEQELRQKSAYTVGKTHSVRNVERYAERMKAIDFALAHDDGLKHSGYEKADIILIGVSRCGKTPSCIYMALHFGVLAANYPFTEEDLVHDALPKVLQPYKHKLFGLTIEPKRLHQIRQERRPNSTYSSLERCITEIKKVEGLYQHEGLPYLDSTPYSVEEISTKIMANFGMRRRF